MDDIITGRYKKDFVILFQHFAIFAGVKIFPYILARLGGLPFDQLGELAIDNLPELEDYLRENEEFIRQKQAVIHALEESPGHLHCGYMLKSLFHLKVDLEHGRNVRISERLADNLLESEQPYFDELMRKIGEHMERKKAIENRRKDFRSVYDKMLWTCRSTLQKFAASEPLQKGLVLASNSLMDQIAKYRGIPVKNFRKKEKQTERSVLKYLSRIAAKTSPFSTFTPLSVFSLESQRGVPRHAGSYVRLNNYLFLLWRDVLNHYPPFYRKLAMGLNPCLKKKKDKWIFLLNSRNVESVQSVESNELVEFVVGQFSGKKQELAFTALVDRLTEAIDASGPAIESFLLDLVSYGLLEWRWPFSGLDTEWDLKLEVLLETVEKDDLLISFSKLLKQIQSDRRAFSLASPDVRSDLLEGSHRLCRQFSEHLIGSTGIAEGQQVVDFESMQHFKADRFAISRERLFFEDTVTPFKPVWSKPDLKPVIEELDRLLTYLQAFSYNKQKEEFLQFFKEHYDYDASIDLFSFYEAYYKRKHTGESGLQKVYIEKQLTLQKELFDRFAVSEAGILSIPLSFFEQSDLTRTNGTKAKLAASLGTLVHLFPDNGLLKAFTESSFLGHGKMMGRFLHLFPPAITRAVQDWNTRLQGNLCWIENKDASLYNPNLHPPLIPLEIRMPGSQNALPAEQCVSITDLIVTLSENRENLILVRRSDGQGVFIFDLGFEAPESRSPMYRLLLAFAYETVSQKLLSNIVNHRFLKDNSENIIRLPRIAVGKRLIIQRKTWLIPKGLLPFKALSEPESDYFLRIHSWLLEHQLPSKVFIRIRESAPEIKTGNKDDYKPQYIDFGSPLFVHLFQKSIKKVEKRLTLEEVLPFPAEKIDNRTYVSEYLVQWERGGVN